MEFRDGAAGQLGPAGSSRFQPVPARKPLFSTQPCTTPLRAHCTERGLLKSRHITPKGERCDTCPPPHC